MRAPTEDRSAGVHQLSFPVNPQVMPPVLDSDRRRACRLGSWAVFRVVHRIRTALAGVARVRDDGPVSRAGRPVIDSQERSAETAPSPTRLERLRIHPATIRVTAWGVFCRDRLHHPLRAHPIFGFPYRIAITVFGAATVILGLIMVPAPGPGWLIVIAGLGVLSTEFSWARRLLDFTKRSVAAWTRWVLRQPLALRMAVGALGFLLLVATLLTSLRLSGWTGFPFS